MVQKNKRNVATEEEIEFARLRYELGVPNLQIAKECGRDRSTVYNWAKNNGWERKNEENHSIEFLPYSEHIKQSHSSEQPDINIDFDLREVKDFLKSEIDAKFDTKFNELTQELNKRLAISELQVAATTETSTLSTNAEVNKMAEVTNEKYESIIQNLSKELEDANWRINSLLKILVGERN